MRSYDKSIALYERTRKSLAGGVSSNVRYAATPVPLFFVRGEGARLYDVDGNRLIDYYLGMGPMILGHTPADVISAATAQMQKGLLYGGQSGPETEAARLFCEMVPCAERMRFCSSGSEAVQCALRLARTHTGRRVVIKFAGHYHGWFDNILWSTMPPAGATAPVPGSKGQKETIDELEVLPWNDLETLTARLAKGDVAGIIMESIMCNQGAILPAPGYLEGVRDACTKYGTVLIFDEVVTGFRSHPGGIEFRTDLERFPVGFQRLRPGSDLLVHATEVVPGEGEVVVASGLCCLNEPRQGLAVMTRLDQKIANVVVRVAVVRVEFNRALAFRDGLFDAALHAEDPCQVRMGLGGGKQLDRLAVMLDRLHIASVDLVPIAAVVRLDRAVSRFFVAHPVTRSRIAFSAWTFFRSGPSFS